MAEEASSSSTADPVMRILLMGRKGSGRSSSGNTILGENRFAEQECEVSEGQTQIGHRRVHVLDCPDVLDPDVDKEKLQEQLLSKSSAGLSSVLLVLPLVKKVENEEKILDYIKHLFGPEVQKYIMILFTHENKARVSQHLQQKANVDLQRLLTECGRRYHCINNKRRSEGQRTHLLDKIERLEEENGGKFMRKQMRRTKSIDTVETNFSGESSSEQQDNLHQAPESKDQISSGSAGRKRDVLGNVVNPSLSSNTTVKTCRNPTVNKHKMKRMKTESTGVHSTHLA